LHHACIFTDECKRDNSYVAIKVFTRGAAGKAELEKYEGLGKGNPEHQGINFVSEVRFQANLQRPGESHFAIGLEPMWENLSVIQSRWPDNRLDLYLLKETLWNVLMALDYVHTERKIIHTSRGLCKSLAV
jgi:hypothetical protein